MTRRSKDELRDALASSEARVAELERELAEALARADRAESAAASVAADLGGGPVRVTVRQAPVVVNPTPIRMPGPVVTTRKAGRVVSDKPRPPESGFAPEA